MLRSLYCHPNGQIPAYEWNFSDVNPPVHAWATLFLYKIERDLGREDVKFLERSFHGLALNFTEPLGVGRFGRRRSGRSALPDLGGQVFGQNQFAAGKQRGPLEGVAQFANISGPGIAHQVIGHR